MSRAFNDDGSSAQQWVTIKNRNPAQSCDYRRLPVGIGPVHDVPIGTTFSSRDAAFKVHQMTQAGIAGTHSTGASAICLNGGYVDDFDSGFRIIYTGSSGADVGLRLSSGQSTNMNRDQKWTEGNKALHTSMKNNWPVRVLRGPKSSIEWAPRGNEGYRYDGLYMIRKCWIQRGRTGVKIIRFAMERLHDQGPLFVHEAVIEPPDYANDEDYQSEWPILDDDDEIQRPVKAYESFETVDPQHVYIKAKAAVVEPRGRLSDAEIAAKKLLRQARRQEKLDRANGEHHEVAEDGRGTGYTTSSQSGARRRRERSSSPERSRQSRTVSPAQSRPAGGRNAERPRAPVQQQRYRARSRSRSPPLPVARPRKLDRFALARQF